MYLWPSVLTCVYDGGFMFMIERCTSEVNYFYFETVRNLYFLFLPTLYHSHVVHVFTVLK